MLAFRAASLLTAMHTIALPGICAAICTAIPAAGAPLVDADMTGIWLSPRSICSMPGPGRLVRASEGPVRRIAQPSVGRALEIAGFRTASLLTGHQWL